MAGSPEYKVYMGSKDYRAAFKSAEDAAMFAAFLGDGATVRYVHRLTLWTEGKEKFSAAESYDDAAHVMHNRLAGI